jgi:hypothetical protein
MAIPQPPKKTPSRTAEALALVDAGWTAYAAAKHLDIRTPTIYSALKARKAKADAAAGVCPSCGGPVGVDGRHKASKLK